jgi:hypothetical protein
MDFGKMQKIVMKIGYFFIALSILAVIALLFFRNHLLNLQSGPQKTLVNQYNNETKFKYSGMSISVDTSKTVENPANMDKKSVTDEKAKAEADPFPPVSEQK